MSISLHRFHGQAQSPALRLMFQLQWKNPHQSIIVLHPTFIALGFVLLCSTSSDTRLLNTANWHLLCLHSHTYGVCPPLFLSAPLFSCVRHLSQPSVVGSNAKEKAGKQLKETRRTQRQEPALYYTRQTLDFMRLLVNRWSTVSPWLSLQGCLTWIVSPGLSHLDCLGGSAIKRVCCHLQFIHFTGNKKAVVIPRITGQRVLLNLTKMEDARIFVICLLSVATSSPTKSLCSSAIYCAT